MASNVIENIFKLFEENGGECYIVELEADIKKRRGKWNILKSY